MDCETCCLCLTCFGYEASIKTKYSIAKWYYLTGFIITAVATWVLRDYADIWLAENIDAFQQCAVTDMTGTCSGQQVAMRISFANFCFFALHAVLTLFLTKESDPRVGLHAGLWLWKTVLWLGTLIGFFFIPARALYGYAQVARIGSGFFLVLQLILLINLVYEINEWLVSKETGWAWTLLIGGAAASFGAGLALIGLSYHYYSPEATCHLNTFFTTITLIAGLALVGVLFVPNRAASAGLLTSGLVFLYACYLLYSALNSEPSDYECKGSTGSRWISVVAFFIAIAAVMYSTFSAGVASRDMFGFGSSADDVEPLPYRADFFHLVFALGSMYIAMLFSNWQVSPSTEDFELDQGWISTWVKIVSKWVCELLYVWTVIAPALFPDRDFGPAI
mmetsp:Transcript_36425/g.81073  ORF Transcript_36425/g.81073 Transcript_36425/m.81073 type:complete len:392 (+) Transcript_36425:260-1435(+)|eukprot:CAMPEP_0202902466 /NCGR_PEP_ID=MMETSP1392-20130828/16868_1 /ASSEMBLY_ACC=CAM_ASM_000868 /TAXON_ID=225041 /ORGANISM="Chlamydomonas chlamydogama, Strain SAG 11-48b" /LENGTH=391 /DNA_ID=CAMNT_0049589229 /DNA_START=257 /DNA_END=1432 /DNA_ORIENTATION=+